MKGNRPRTKFPSATTCADYTFRQRFRVPAPKAFRWCIDFEPYDWVRGGGHGSRKVVWVTPRTVILDDVTPSASGRRVRKVRLVQVYPEDRRWVSTHIVGPAVHSQFRYRIVPDGPNASALVFEGRELRWSGPRLSDAENRRLARRLGANDAALWKRFAKAMESDPDLR